MKITVLTPDLSHNCLGRAYTIAKVLQKEFNVEIAGPMFGEEIWAPVRNDKTISFKTVKISGKFLPYFQLLKLYSQIDGDIIYASKPLPSSFGIGLLCKYFKSKKVILDIDDWQRGFLIDSIATLTILEKVRYYTGSLIYLYSLSSWWGTVFCEWASTMADAIVVSNSFLQNKFGGEIVSHVRDTNKYSPEQYDIYKMRAKYNLPQDRKIVAFSGTPRKHKGLRTLIDAVASIKQSEKVFLVILGIDANNAFCREIIAYCEKLFPGNYRILGFQPFDLLPEVLITADIIVIPQENTNATKGQIPAKIFDAMAIGKPIIASAVNDIPEILNNCGWVINASDPELLSKTIVTILTNPNEARRKGVLARNKCIQHFSYDTALKILRDLIIKTNEHA